VDFSARFGSRYCCAHLRRICLSNRRYFLKRFEPFARAKTMKPATKLKATEERLEEIRISAAEAAQRTAPLRPMGSPQNPKLESYYGLPALKPPVWTWQVPLYFFLGGIAGMSACTAFIAQLFHGGSSLIRFCLWTGLLGAALCPLLLIADLGRPMRFLNMLRVFKLRFGLVKRQRR
jgi:hypothetical protein